MAAPEMECSQKLVLTLIAHLIFWLSSAFGLGALAKTGASSVFARQLSGLHGGSAHRSSYAFKHNAWKHKEGMSECAGMGDGWRRLRKKRASPGGVLLWSPGRAATGTVYQTLFDATSRSGTYMKACCGAKEGFWYHKNMDDPDHCTLTEDNMAHCRKEAGKHVFFTHVKPYWLTKSFCPTKNATELMYSAKAAGFKLVVVSNRANLLAREVSSWKLSNRNSDGDGEDGTPFRIDTDDWEIERRYLEEGRAAARAADLVVVDASFEAVVDDACAVVSSIVCSGVAAGLPLEPPERCEARSQHTDQRRERTTLEEDVGARAARLVQKKLKGTADEWMLDLSRLHP